MNASVARLVIAWCPDKDEDDFMVKLRIQSFWDEAQFQSLLQISREALDLLQHGEPINEHVNWILDGKIDRTIHLMSHPGFRAEPPPGMSKGEYDVYLDERVAELRAIREAFLTLAAEHSRS